MGAVGAFHPAGRVHLPGSDHWGDVDPRAAGLQLADALWRAHVTGLPLAPGIHLPGNILWTLRWRDLGTFSRHAHLAADLVPDGWRCGRRIPRHSFCLGSLRAYVLRFWARFDRLDDAPSQACRPETQCPLDPSQRAI